MMRMNFWNISHFISRAAYLASQVCERKVGHFSEQWRFAWCLTSSKTSNGLSRHKKKMTIRKKSIKKNFMVSNIFLDTVGQISESYKSTFMNVLHQETLCFFFRFKSGGNANVGKNASFSCLGLLTIWHFHASTRSSFYSSGAGFMLCATSLEFVYNHETHKKTTEHRRGEVTSFLIRIGI